MILATLWEQGLKACPKELKDKILDSSNYTDAGDASIASFDYNSKRLIVSYSAKRAAKDSHDRETAIASHTKKTVQRLKTPKIICQAMDTKNI